MNEDSRLSKALDKAASLLSGYGYCTHYPGYICDKGFTTPGVCESCIKEHLLSFGEKPPHYGGEVEA